MSQFKLMERLVKLSEAAIWDEAKLEWELLDIYQGDEPDTCLCGHNPIRQICVLKNKKNLSTTIVGNCCVEKFTDLSSDKIFQVVKRVKKDIGKSLNGETIEHAYKKGWIDDWEKGFYFDIMRKRKLSSKQKNKKIRINESVLSNMKKNG